MKSIVRIPVVVFAIVLCSSSYAQEETQPTKVFPKGRLVPVDEAKKDEEFFAFYQKFVKAVEEKDREALLECIDEDIKCSLGGEDGIEDFKTMWQLNENPEKSHLWFELGELIRIGGKFQSYGPDKYFMLPSIHVDFPDNFDPFEFYSVTGLHVRLREGPSLDSPVIKLVSYQIVRLVNTPDAVVQDNSHPHYNWQKIELFDGTIGYMWSKFIRSPIGLRAGFQKRDGDWKMVSLLAGD